MYISESVTGTGNPRWLYYIPVTSVVIVGTFGEVDVYLFFFAWPAGYSDLLFGNLGFQRERLSRTGHCEVLSKFCLHHACKCPAGQTSLYGPVKTVGIYVTESLPTLVTPSILDSISQWVVKR